MPESQDFYSNFNSSHIDKAKIDTACPIFQEYEIEGMVRYCRGDKVIKYNDSICDSGNLQIFIDNHEHKHVPEILGGGEHNPDLVE